ncbi:MAG: 50S ribosomal protein L23 [Patescibacteria group bacterium]|jgi:large subunit ribosomal protein L23|nr:50S ribosomal protein L23 [Patescibacteria group bacterium]
MVAFWNKDDKDKSEDSAKNEEQKTAVATKKNSDKKPKKKKISADLKKKSDLVNKIVINPIISEKAMNQQVLGKYVFEVSQKANKKNIAEAVEALYGVNVEDVNLINYKQKKRNFRNFRGQQKAVKKAIVTIKSGQEIKLFNE